MYPNPIIRLEIKQMKRQIPWIAIAAVLVTLMAWGPADASRALFERFYVAEVPPADQGGTVRVGVNLPRSAKIAKTDVKVAKTNLDADMTGWADCDNDSKSCDIAELSIIRFHRTQPERIQVLAVDIRNTGNEPRYVKLRVVFQPQSGQDITDPTECGSGVKVKCGFSRPVESP
jgi:hypothetical protein